jgi:anti-sigma B factor antagonist
MSTVPQVRKKLLSVARKTASKAMDVVFDLSGVHELDTAGVALLVEVLRYVSHRHGKLRLTGVNEKAQRLFRLTRLDHVFEIKTDSQSVA